MIPITPDTKVVVTRSATNPSGILLMAGLTADDSAICENIEGWDSSGSRQHDIRQATFDTKTEAGVYIGSKYSPRKDLVLHVAFSDNSLRDFTLDFLEDYAPERPLWLRTYELVDPDTYTYEGGEGYRSYYSGYSITEVFNKGSRVAFRFESLQAVPTTF